MKKSSKEISRIISLIENERLSIKNNFEDLLIKDLERVLKDYFELASNPSVEILKKDKKYEININFLANSIKSFSTLPEFLE